METIALRLYGKNDLRLEKFDLPDLKDTEILADIQSNSICMSSYKATIQGADHKRVPDDVAQHPVIVGHELCGNIIEVGARVESKIRPGAKYSIQPALNIPGRELEAPGYTVIYHAGGLGDRGWRRADEPTGTSTNCVFVIACDDERIVDRIVEGVRTILSRSGGICLVSDAMWVRH